MRGQAPLTPIFAIFTYKMHYLVHAPRGEGRRDPERPWLHRNRIQKGGSGFLPSQFFQNRLSIHITTGCPGVGERIAIPARIFLRRILLNSSSETPGTFSLRGLSCIFLNQTLLNPDHFSIAIMIAIGFSGQGLNENVIHGSGTCPLTHQSRVHPNSGPSPPHTQPATRNEWRVRVFGWQRRSRVGSASRSRNRNRNDPSRYPACG